MKRLNQSFLILVVTSLAACGGQQLVEFADAPPRTAAPLVSSTDPADSTNNVPVGKAISATFSEAMDPTTLTTATFTVKRGATSVAGTVSYAGTKATFVPANPLALDATFSASITTGAKSAAGIGIAQKYDWTFATGTITAGPRVVTTNPLENQTGMCVPRIQATFSEAMDPLTITEATFRVTGPGNAPVSGEVGYTVATRTATFAPASALALNTAYTATITTGAETEAGGAMQTDRVWSFTTSANECVMPPNLRSLATFVAVAGAGLTNSNTQLPAVTTLNGDVGLNPVATCMSDGSPCNPPEGAPRINGTLYANDPAGKAAQAKADLVLAYNDAQGRPPGTIITANLAGQVLAPGIYTSQPSSSMDIAVGGTVTLDGQGDQNAVWIFQIGSTLTANNDSQVLLVNGAKAANVFWAIGSSSTIGSNVDFKGTVLASASNSVGTGSTVEGRLVCTSGAITLLSNVITLPVP